MGRWQGGTAGASEGEGESEKGREMQENSLTQTRARAHTHTQVADMFNHDSKACTAFRFSNGRFQVAAGRKTVRGHEVVISYGTVPSDVLLANYGFVPKVCACSCVCACACERDLILTQALRRRKTCTTT